MTSSRDWPRKETRDSPCCNSDTVVSLPDQGHAQMHVASRNMILSSAYTVKPSLSKQKEDIDEPSSSFLACQTSQGHGWLSLAGLMRLMRLMRVAS